MKFRIFSLVKYVASVLLVVVSSSSFAQEISKDAAVVSAGEALFIDDREINVVPVLAPDGVDGEVTRINVDLWERAERNPSQAASARPSLRFDLCWPLRLAVSVPFMADLGIGQPGNQRRRTGWAGSA